MITTALSYFVKIAETGSFTGAARALRVSQPSLSVAMKHLEQELETTLFVRTRRGVSLTRTGEVLLREARAASGALARAKEEIHGLESDPRGDFTLGVHESLGAYFLPALMGALFAQYPRIRLSLWNGNSRDVQRAVVAREIDFGIVVNPEPQQDCVIQRLFDDCFQLIATRELVASARDERALFATQTLVHVPVLRQTSFLVTSLEREGLRPPRELRCSSMELVKSLVLEGVGVGALPYRVATYRVPDGRIVPLYTLPYFDDTISLVRRYDMHETRATRIVLDALKSHGERMPSLPPSAVGDKRRKRAR